MGGFSAFFLAFILKMWYNIINIIKQRYLIIMYIVGADIIRPMMEYVQFI